MRDQSRSVIEVYLDQVRELRSTARLLGNAQIAADCDEEIAKVEAAVFEGRGQSEKYTRNVLRNIHIIEEWHVYWRGRTPKSVG